MSLLTIGYGVKYLEVDKWNCHDDGNDDSDDEDESDWTLRSCYCISLQGSMATSCGHSQVKLP